MNLEEIAKAVADAIREATAPLHAEIEALKSRPMPQDGKSVTLEDVAPMLKELVSALPVAKDGKDACDLEILPAIDTDKSYPRGAWAKHDGGLWRSFEQTHGLRGWECIVEGVKGVSVAFDGERAVSLELETSTGTKAACEAIFPSMIYRGIWREQSYAVGDCVTLGGSVWHCNEPTSARPGTEGAKGWQLAVKRGERGKSYTEPVSLENGVKLS